MDDSKLGEAVRPYVERKMLGKKVTTSFLFNCFQYTGHELRPQSDPYCGHQPEIIGDERTVFFPRNVV